MMTSDPSFSLPLIGGLGDFLVLRTLRPDASLFDLHYLERKQQSVLAGFGVAATESINAGLGLPFIAKYLLIPVEELTFVCNLCRVVTIEQMETLLRDIVIEKKQRLPSLSKIRLRKIPVNRSCLYPERYIINGLVALGMVVEVSEWDMNGTKLAREVFI